MEMAWMTASGRKPLFKFCNFGWLNGCIRRELTLDPGGDIVRDDEREIEADAGQDDGSEPGANFEKSLRARWPPVS